MRKTLLALALLGTAATTHAFPAAAQDEAPKLLTVIATGEPQTQLMALILTQASLQKGAEVRIMLCGPGGDIALNEAPPSATQPLAPRGLSPQGLLTRLIEVKVPVSVCAIYLPNKALPKESLIEGVGVAMPPDVAEYMLGEDVRLLTF